MKVIKDVAGNTYTLSTKRLTEKSSPYKRYVILSELKAVLRGIFPWEWNLMIFPAHIQRYFAMDTNGRLSIGCKDFGVTASRAIYKAMGVRRKVQ
jgi:hypothetical protein